MQMRVGCSAKRDTLSLLGSWNKSKNWNNAVLSRSWLNIIRKCWVNRCHKQICFRKGRSYMYRGWEMSIRGKWIGRTFLRSKKHNISVNLNICLLIHVTLAVEWVNLQWKEAAQNQHSLHLLILKPLLEWRERLLIRNMHSSHFKLWLRRGSKLNFTFFHNPKLYY